MYLRRPILTYYLTTLVLSRHVRSVGMLLFLPLILPTLALQRQEPMILDVFSAKPLPKDGVLFMILENDTSTFGICLLHVCESLPLFTFFLFALCC